MRNILAERRLPVGAEPLAAGGVHFRVWAPSRKRVEVVSEGLTAFPLSAEGNGYFSGQSTALAAGARYRFRLDGESTLYPDPVSRFQPEGPHGPSEIVDPGSFSWTDHDWRGVALPGQVIYEMHIGTFTREGTFEAAGRQLPELADLGVTVLEIMPVADFPGRFGWGYDGVDLFAPTRLYGRPDDMRRFVDQAHAAGLGVILDVVYNHFGPDGNYLKAFSPAYMTDRHKNEWGEAINFDGPDAGPVREFFIVNAGYWIAEFHLDGLRLDATQQIFDSSPRHILAEIAASVRRAARGRRTLVVAENETQEARLVRPPEQGGYGLDGIWNDDFHHAARVALTGHNRAYYSDYLGTPQELLSAVKWGFLYQGQHSQWQKKRRGTPAFDIHPAAFVTFIENHDQVSNSGRGERLAAIGSPGKLRALTALLLLGPGTPMLFQGQEFAPSSPFVYFADHEPKLSKLVREGRAKFLSQFPNLAAPEMQSLVADPGDPATFERCKLDFTERQRNTGAYALHRDLLKLRRDDPVFRNPRAGGVDGAVLGESALALRFFAQAQGADDRLLLVNLGRDRCLCPIPEPLLAAPEGKKWRLLWSSEDPRYGGAGTPPLSGLESWRVPGECAVILVPVNEEPAGHG
jgi:maltooligosyltrehalose trehalohydrolase